MDEINERELRIDIYRDAGMNYWLDPNRYPVVRLTHLPTGLVTECKDHPSARENKVQALKDLREKIREHQCADRVD